MKKSNIRAILISLSFLFWIGVSFTQPIIKLFNNPNTFDYVVIINNFFMIIALLVVVMPKVIKKTNTEGLDLKVGSTTFKKPKKGCKSCKKKKK